MASQVGIWRVTVEGPERVERSRVRLESHLEDWIESNPTLLAESLRIVGRQVHVPGGFVDLLCVDVQGRWVIVELKRDRLYREALVQALDYAASIQGASVDELRNFVLSAAQKHSRTQDELSLVDEQLDHEEEERNVAVLIAGLGVDPGLERVMDFLAQYDIPMSVVLFQVFDLEDGSQLLVREVLEEESVTAVRTPTRAFKSVEAITALADQYGVGRGFRRIIEAADRSGALALRPYTRSVMIAPSQMKNRFLMVLTPDSAQGLRINHGPEAFAEFFPDLTASDVEDTLGPGGDRWYAGTELEDRASRLEQFFDELPEVTDDEESPKADRASVFKVAALIMPGEWTSYGDLSKAVTGRSSAAMAVGQLAANDPDFPNPHRVINSTGRIPRGWRSETGEGPEECRRRLEADGVMFLPDGSADPAQRLAIEELRDRASE